MAAFTLNKQQIMTSVGTILTALGPVLTLTGTVTPSQWAGMSTGVTQAVDSGITLAGAVMTVVGIVQVWWSNRKASQVQAVQSMGGDNKGVQVHVDMNNPNVPDSVKAMVDDKASPDVVPMTGGPVPTAEAR